MERFVIEALIVSVGRTQSTDDNQEEEILTAYQSYLSKGQKRNDNVQGSSQTSIRLFVTGKRYADHLTYQSLVLCCKKEL